MIAYFVFVGKSRQWWSQKWYAFTNLTNFPILFLFFLQSNLDIHQNGAQMKSVTSHHRKTSEHFLLFASTFRWHTCCFQSFYFPYTCRMTTEFHQNPGTHTEANWRDFRAIPKWFYTLFGSLILVQYTGILHLSLHYQYDLIILRIIKQYNIEIQVLLFLRWQQLLILHWLVSVYFIFTLDH